MDERSSREGQSFLSEEGRVPGRTTDELDEAADRLDDSSWERFETAPRRGPDSEFLHDEEHNPIVGFLDQQLRDRPIPTLLAALAAGWLVGKLVR